MGQPYTKRVGLSLFKMIFMGSNIRFSIVAMLLTLFFWGNSQAQQLPFFEGFEDASTYGEWTFVHSASQNKWHIGTATSSQGDRSLYVSIDGGQTPGYSNDASGIAAYTTYNLPVGYYNVSFDYRVIGEVDSRGVGLDSLYVYWVTDPNETIMETRGDKPQSLSVYRQPVYNNDALKGPDLWHNTSFQIRVRAANSPSRLVFYWINNSANIVPPGVCIDNIQISAVDAPCAIPTNLTVTHENGAKLIWDETGASSYQIYYKNNTSGEEGMVDNVLESPYYMSGLQKGIYTFWLRGVCGTDTSAWATYTCHVLAVSTDKCINFIDIHNPDVVEARYGRYGESAKANIGVMDFGYESVKSQHTVHYQPNEYDPKTNGLLKTIAPGELASVRLGNWYGGSEAECLNYKFTVDAANPILIIKYAAVLENIGHNGQDFKQPRFIIRVTDSRGVPLNETCLSVYYLTGSPEMPPGWNRIIMGYLSNGTPAFIEWKDWTTLGMNLSDYIGRQVNVYLETGDCGPAPGEGCFGYAYFSMDCVPDKLEGLTCGAQSEELDTIWAPEGFRYEWVKATDPNRVLYTDRYFVPTPGDTATYKCRMHFVDPGKEACSFELTASLLPRYPAADAEYTICRKSVQFTDKSFVFTRNGISDETCDVYWDFGDGVGTSTEHNPLYEYAEPGTYTVTLLASIDDGMCDSLWVDTITVSADTLKTVMEKFMCKGDMVLFGENYLREPGIYSDTLLTSYGCDSISVLDLKFYDTYADSIVCGGEPFVFEGETLNLPSGTHELVYKNIKSVYGCDSILRLVVSDEILAEAQDPICADDPEASFTLLSGLAESVRVEIDAVPFEPVEVPIVDNTFSIPLPEGVKAGHYTGKFYFANDYCGESERVVSFTILYPSQIITQRWNDVLAVRNGNYNGGYNFEGASFQWFMNGEPMEGKTGSVLYVPDTDLDPNSEYAVSVTDANGNVLMSCGFVPELIDDETVILKQNSFEKGESVQPQFTSEQPVRMRLMDLYGVELQSADIQLGERLTMPMSSGMYLLEYIYYGGKREVSKVVVR